MEQETNIHFQEKNYVITSYSIHYTKLYEKVHESSVILMGIILVLTILLGPVFCGWVCPLGSIQEWFGKIGKRLFGKRYNQFIPRKVDKYLRYIRYITLVLIVYQSTQSLKLLFQNVDPFYALFKFWTSEIAIGSIVVRITSYNVCYTKLLRME